jgi:hypothetical protein
MEVPLADSQHGMQPHRDLTSWIRVRSLPRRREAPRITMGLHPKEAESARPVADIQGVKSRLVAIRQLIGRPRWRGETGFGPIKPLVMPAYDAQDMPSQVSAVPTGTGRRSPPVVLPKRLPNAEQDLDRREIRGHTSSGVDRCGRHRPARNGVRWQGAHLPILP